MTVGDEDGDSQTEVPENPRRGRGGCVCRGLDPGGHSTTQGVESLTRSSPSLRELQPTSFLSPPHTPSPGAVHFLVRTFPQQYILSTPLWGFGVYPKLTVRPGSTRVFTLPREPTGSLRPRPRS